MPPYTYTDILQTFEDSNCKLLTTQDEFIQLLKETKPCNVKLNIISSCGHNHSVIFKNFKHKNAGFLCKDCTSKKVSNKLKEKIQDNVYMQREIDVTRRLQSLIDKSFESILTDEGCESDLIIKPKDNINNKWLRIQIKLTEDICKYDKVYRFCVHKNYEHHVIICHCINTDAYWLIPGEYVSVPKNNKFTIGKYNGKYLKYHTQKEDIQDMLMIYYNNIQLYSKEECIHPKSVTNIKEIFYREKIYKSLSFLDVKTPNYTNMVYDLLINDSKVQEKVMSYNSINKKGTKKSYWTSLYKRKGNKQFQNYNIFDNDFYWFHIPDTSTFFVIPEYELYDRDFISLYENIGKKRFCVDFNCTGWVSKYMFDYEDINRDKIVELFDKDYEDITNSISYIKMMDFQII